MLNNFVSNLFASVLFMAIAIVYVLISEQKYEKKNSAKSVFVNAGIFFAVALAIDSILFGLYHSAIEGDAFLAVLLLQFGAVALYKHNRETE